MTHRLIRNVAMLVVAVGATSALGQHMDLLRSRTDAGFDAARLATRTSFEALAGYPKDVRDAILTLSTRPDVIIRLNEARLGGTSTVEALVGPLGPDMASAARLVTGRPDVLQTLVERLPVVTLMGECAGDDMPAIRAILDRESENRSMASRGLVEAWRKRATAKPTVQDQLRIAAADFSSSQTALQPLTSDNVMLADHPSEAPAADQADSGLDWTAAITQRVVKPLPSDLGNASSGFGYAAGGPSPVTGLPGHDEVYFTLVHSDKYPELAAAIIEQWYYEPNPDGFRAAVDSWYTTYQETLPQSLGGQGEYLPAILKERMQFEKRYIAAMRDPAARRMYRSEFLEASLKDYPALARVRDNEIIARLNVTPDRVMGGPISKSTRSGSSGGGRSSSGQSSSSTNRGSSRSASRGGRNSDVSGMASSSRNTRGNNNGNSRFGNSNSGSGQGNFGSSNRSGFGGSNSGFGGSGFGSGSSGFGSGSSGFGSGSSGFGSNSGFGSSGNSFGGSSRFGGSNNSSSMFDN